MYASEWSAGELRKFLHFHIKKLLFLLNFLLVLQKLCRYKWHTCRLTCTDRFPNVPTKLRNYIIGPGAEGQFPPCTPPPPGLCASVVDTHSINSHYRSPGIHPTPVSLHHYTACMRTSITSSSRLLNKVELAFTSLSTRVTSHSGYTL